MPSSASNPDRPHADHGSDQAGGSREFSVLAVCTGNICRSPAVERLLASRLDAPVTVRSAGTHALVGEPISAPMVPLLEDRGGVAAGFRARQVTEAMIREADLVLALTRDHRAIVVEACPSAVRRTFTLREFARLAQQVDASVIGDGASSDRLARLIPLAAGQRGRARVAAEDDDVIDPYRRDPQVYATSIRQIAEAVDGIVRMVGR